MGEGYTPPPSAGGGGGAVSSVAGRTGDVVLAVADVSGAAPTASPSFSGTVTLPSGLVLPANVVLPSTADISAKLGSSSTTAAAGNDSRITGAAQKASNLSDLASTATALANLGAAPSSGIAPSAVTGTAVVTADSRLSDARTPTAHKTSHATGGSDALAASDVGAAALASPVFTGTPSLPTGTTGVTQASSDSSTKLATTAHVKAQIPIPPDRIISNVTLPLVQASGMGSNFVGITALKPIWIPIDIPGMATFTLANLAARLTALFAGSHVGLAVYTATYASAAHVSATLVAQLNTAFDTSVTAPAALSGPVTTGAAGSGAAPLAMDFTANRYLLGMMASDVTTVKLFGYSLAASLTGHGVISWTGTARSSTTDWPSSFTEAANVAAISTGTPIALVDLVTPTGVFYL